jgi:hypothetical protein
MEEYGLIGRLGSGVTSTETVFGSSGKDRADFAPGCISEIERADQSNLNVDTAQAHFSSIGAGKFLKMPGRLDRVMAARHPDRF